MSDTAAKTQLFRPGA